MPRLRRVFGFVFALAVAIALGLGFGRLSASDGKEDKPTLMLRANPNIAFAPVRVFLSAELRGGPNDAEEYYCTSVEWDWGDDTKSESTPDCEPYQAGKSEIKRKFMTERVFQSQGSYRVVLRLKKKDKAVASATVTVQVRPGIRDLE